MAKKPKNGTSKRSLEEKKRLFIEAYLSNGGNATDAALQAGYTVSGASKTGYRLSKDPYVLSMIRQRQDKLASDNALTTEAIIKSIAADVHFDPAKLFDDNGQFLALKDMDESTRKALQSVELVQIGSENSTVFVRKVKFPDKVRAREQAMKNLGMFERDNAQKIDPIRELLSGLSGNVLGVKK